MIAGLDPWKQFQLEVLLDSRSVNRTLVLHLQFLLNTVDYTVDADDILTALRNLPKRQAYLP